jgi:hypothetical protein
MCCSLESSRKWGSLTTISDPADDSRIGGMMFIILMPRRNRILVEGFILASILVSAAHAQSAHGNPNQAPATPAASREGSVRSAGFDPHAKKFYQLIWALMR